MELSRRFLANLSNNIKHNMERGTSRYEGVKGAKALANDLGGALELMTENEKVYITEKSYDDLYKKVYDETNYDLSFTDWIDELKKGMENGRLNHSNHSKNSGIER